jgi:hypothetical protein
MAIFGRKPINNELAPPAIATDGSEALELLRVWASTSPGPHQIVLKKGFDEPGVWGIILADIARTAAEVYASEGVDFSVAFQRIQRVMADELAAPSSPAEKI